MKKELEVMKQFEVEELEERLEFAKWTASASCTSDGTVTVTVTCEF